MYWEEYFEEPPYDPSSCLPWRRQPFMKIHFAPQRADKLQQARDYKSG